MGLLLARVWRRRLKVQVFWTAFLLIIWNLLFVVVVVVVVNFILISLFVIIIIIIIAIK